VKEDSTFKVRVLEAEEIVAHQDYVFLGVLRVMLFQKAGIFILELIVFFRVLKRAFLL
jgi:hypothetical protein